MRLIVLFSVFCQLLFVQNSLLAQRSAIDSLLILERKQSHTNLQNLSIYNQLAYLYQYVQIDSGIIYADKAIILAGKLTNSDELVSAYNYKANLLYQLLKSEEVNKTVNQALLIAKQTNNSTGLAECYLYLSLIKDGNDKVELLNKSLQLFNKNSHTDGIASVYSELGEYYLVLDVDSSEYYYKLALAMFKKEGDILKSTEVINRLSRLFMFKIEYQKQLEYANLALKLSEADGNFSGQVSAYLNIGNMYYSKSDFLQTISNYLKGLKISEQMNFTRNTSSFLNNIGGVYLELKNYDKALYYLKKGLDKSEGYPNNLIYAYSMIGYVYAKQNKFVEATYYNKNALQLSLKTNNTDRIIGAYTVLAEIAMLASDYTSTFNYINNANEAALSAKFPIPYSKLYYLMAMSIKNSPENILKQQGIDIPSRNKKVMEYLLKGVDFAIKDEDNGQLKDFYLNISNEYFENGDLDKSLTYLKLYDIVKDTILSGDNFLTLANLELKYETEKKEQQIELLRRDKAVQQTEIEIQKSTRNAFIGGFILFSLIGGVTFNRYRVKQKTNRKLSLALSRLKIAQQQLIEQEKLASLGQLTAGIAHEIQNPLNFVINFSDLSDDLFDEYDQAKTLDEKRDILNNLDNNIKIIESHSLRANNIVNRMLLHSRDFSPEKTLTDINLICKIAIENSYENMVKVYPEFKCNIDTRFDSRITQASIVNQDISRVLLNLINNALYAVYDKSRQMHNKNSIQEYLPEVSISTEFSGAAVRIKISDNGNGIPDNIKSKIFQPFFTTKPTNEGTGLGLSISYDIVKAHNGEIIVESQEGNGTTFVVSLPIS